MRRVNILGVEISAVNKETAIQYLLENMDKAKCETSRDCSLSKQKIRKKGLKEGSGEEDSYKNPEIMLQKYS